MFSLVLRLAATWRGMTVLDSVGLVLRYVLVALSATDCDMLLRAGMRVKDDDARNADGGRSQLYAATRSAGFGSEVQKRILLGTFALSAE